MEYDSSIHIIKTAQLRTSAVAILLIRACPVIACEAKVKLERRASF